MQDEDRVPPKRLRASDADRDAVAERLAVALTEGRLDLAEYDRRLTLAMNAVFVGDLLPLVADLPEPDRDQVVPAGTRAPAPASSSPWKEWLDEWRWWLGGAIIMSSIWGVTSIIGGTLLPFWPLIPLGVWAAILLAAAVWPNDESRSR
ncbi:DUF1707 SHOCT-like domain-containing protein [Thermobifida cellulosilytica]|uniref:DUF1707 domain-containing protein n=1 Tax=Thermobifida cellulosilytica TB100 TaxID=665004 RepID=A0A147KHJ8_THECS|nr:DUF1707 domain-containing protein [Thermobifida cellulosilytica]KUP96782.1 hypothetical protein AC529_10675 [Thermobifida cellulosilytica TB100]